MRISVLCSDRLHPVVPSLRAWVSRMSGLGHKVSLHFDRDELVGGDVLFLVSCHEVINEANRQKFAKVLVLHASDLPVGRGWSPHVWAIVGGSSEITLCLLEAAEPVDSGPIWLRARIPLNGDELLSEINEKLFECELELMAQAVEEFGTIRASAQTGTAGPYLRRRTPDDSRLDVHQSIAEQFNLLRVVDNQRFPAFFEYRGKRYLIRIEKADDVS